MSETSSLTELARFVGRSRASGGEAPARQRVVNARGAGVTPSPKRHSVADLLGVVLVLSARTRRMVLPPVEIDIDVFTPEGNRAVRMMMRR
jgi:hypothetical protein